MNSKDFNLKQIIQDRANLESWYEWGQKDDKIELPKYKKCDTIKANASWYNLIRDVLCQLKP